MSCLRTHGRYVQDGLATVHSDDFRRDDAFQSAYARGVQASRGVDPGIEWRVHVAIWAAHIALHVEGDFVECGVNAGFISSAIMHSLQWHTIPRRFYLIDTFSGPVLSQYSQAERQNAKLDVATRAMEAGAYVIDLERVRANFAEWPNTAITQGVVPDVLETIPFEKIAFVHIDMNCALPERTALQFFWNRLSPGSVVLLDDYAYLGSDAQRKAMDDFVRQIGAKILSFPTGQGLIMK
jgi:hypothetical protein